MASMPIRSVYDQDMNFRPADGRGRWEVYTGTFKDAVAEAGTVNSPFASVNQGGVRNWSECNMKVELDERTFSDSGALNVKLAPNYQAIFYVRTNNNDFFEDNLQEGISSDWEDSDSWTENMENVLDELEEAGYPSVWVQDNADFSDSRMVFGLDGNNQDYFSFDVDGDFSNIAQSRVRQAGTDMIDNTEASEEIYIQMWSCRKWNPDYVWPSESSGSGSGGSGGSGSSEGSGGDSSGSGGDSSGMADMDSDETTGNTQGSSNNDGCPEGQMMNAYGVCIIDPSYEAEQGSGSSGSSSSGGSSSGGSGSEDDEPEVSVLTMVLLLGAVGAVIYFALRTGGGGDGV